MLDVVKEKVLVINRWFLPIFGVVSMALFYISNNASITPVGAILVMILSFFGLAVIERLDRIIEQNERKFNA